MKKLPLTSTSNPVLPLLFAPEVPSSKIADAAFDFDCGPTDARGNVPMLYDDMHSDVHNAHRELSAAQLAQADSLAIVGLSELLDDGIVEACGGDPAELRIPLQTVGWAGDSRNDRHARDAYAMSRRMPAWFAKKTIPEFDEPGLGCQAVPNLAHEGVRAEKLIALLRRKRPRVRTCSLLAAKADVYSRVAVLCDVTIGHAHSLLDQALQTVIALPRLRTLAHWHGLDARRVAEAAQATKVLTIAQSLKVDEQMAVLPTDCSITYFRKVLREAVAVQVADREQEKEQADRIARDRNISLFRYDDGSACLSLTGPLTSLEPLYQRAIGTARVIRRHNDAAFADQLTGQDTLDGAHADASSNAGGDSDSDLRPNPQIIDERTIAQLAFDLIAHARPETQVLVQEVHESKLCREDPKPEDSAGAQRHVWLKCPTGRSWLRAQASVVLTVPALSYAGHSSLPGSLAGLVPVPAEVARKFAAESDAIWRVLTDPATGEVLPAQAQRYHIPQATRIALAARWARCTMPNCTRRAETCEPEHLVPFNHADPAVGGQSDFGGLHVMCKQHHDLKTRGVMVPAKDDDGNIVWNLGKVVNEKPLTAVTRPQTSPSNAAQAEILRTVENEIAQEAEAEQAQQDAETARIAAAEAAAEAAAREAAAQETAALEAIGIHIEHRPWPNTTRRAPGAAEGTAHGADDASPDSGDNCAIADDDPPF